MDLPDDGLEPVDAVESVAVTPVEDHHRGPTVARRHDLRPIVEAITAFGGRELWKLAAALAS